MHFFLQDEATLFAVDHVIWAFIQDQRLPLRMQETVDLLTQNEAAIEWTVWPFSLSLCISRTSFSVKMLDDDLPF